jgi:hypothetical protein
MWLAGVFREGERWTYRSWSGHDGDGVDDGGEEDELHLYSLVEESECCFRDVERSRVFTERVVELQKREQSRTGMYAFCTRWPYLGY